MTNVEKIIAERNIPALMKLKSGKSVKTKADYERRMEEIKKIMQEEEYGYIPAPPEHLKVELVKEEKTFCASKAVLRTLKFTVTIDGRDFSFPVYSAIPTSGDKHPAFVHINFRPEVPDRYMPTEEIIDNGFAVFSFCYKEVTSDDGNFKNGIAPYFRRGRRTLTSPGKIAMWAWCAMRVMDYIETLPEIDCENVAVIGHSRLGKTALWCAAQDERFAAAISNDSGYGGAATSKHGHGERVTDFLRYGSWDWFCENFKQFTDEKEDQKPYDQSWLLALIAPRYLCVGSAIEDYGADPQSEFLTSLWASQAWELLGARGLITPDRMPQSGDALLEGNVGYHLRAGTHYLCREDWNTYIRFLNAKS